MRTDLMLLRHARLAFTVLLLAAPAALAIQPHAPAGVPAEALVQLGEPPQVSPVLDADESKAWAQADPAFRAFVREAGAEWSVRWDRRTGHLSFASGTFPAWLPADARVADDADVAATRELLEREARALMARHPGLLAIPPGVTLVRDDSRTVPVDRGRVWQVDFRAEVRGVPVANAHVSFRLNHGHLVQLSQQNLADVLASSETTPRLQAKEADLLAATDLEELLGIAGEGARPIQEPQLALLPLASDPERYEGAVGQGLDFRLAWRTTLRVAGSFETWVQWHDAVSGERLFVFDSNRYACVPPAVPQGRVVGGIYPGPIEEVTEAVHGFPYTAVDNGGPLVTDGNGVFPFAVGNPATTTLSGAFFDMNCAACNTPAQASATVQAPGYLSLGTGGVDEIGNGLSTKAERNCFYHLNIVRQVASKHLDDAATGGFMTRRMPATVNIGQTCNAFYDGTGVNFFQAGGGCNNTGEIADVMQHEWGHALDDNTGGINDGGMSEGMADVVAFLTTHDPRLGPYFFAGNGAGIRNADENVAGVRTWAQRGTLCPGSEVHCMGEIFSQPWWHLARNLRNRAVMQGGAEAAGWFLAERLFFQMLPLAETMNPANANNMYDATTLVDDDDGNLNNGIPDGTEINDAFSHHAFVSMTPRADSADCAALPTPVVSLVTSQDPATTAWQVAISWTTVAGAVEYRIGRNETGMGADVPIATVPAPGLTFRDDFVTEGTSYGYRVMAFAANGCTSIGENQQTTRIADRVVLGVESLVIDDAIAGNDNGAVEPGETLTLVLTARNAGGLAATNVVAELTSTHPGVTIVQGLRSLGNLAPGGTATTTAPHFVIRLSPMLVACPDLITLDISLEATEGCSGSSVAIAVGPPPQGDDLETDRGWTVNPQGTDMATTGIWVRAVPAGTTAQVGEDHTPGAGTTCFVTGNSTANLGNPGNDDVDGGCTTLLSPVYDLRGATGITLSYWRAFSIATAFDDEFVIELSNDGGGAWTEIERIAASTNGWAQASFPLDATLGGPARLLQLRFTACDTGAGSILEAAVDDIFFSGYPCEAPDPRPRLVVDSVVTGDSAAFGGSGNGDSAVDPGERVRLPIVLLNDGNTLATNVAGTLSVRAGGALASDPSGTWANIPVAMLQSTGGAPAHFEIFVPAGTACGSTLTLRLDVTYSGPAGSYTLQHDFTLLVGHVVETPAFADDFEGGDNGFTHGANCMNAGCDDWHHDVCTGISPWDPTDTLVPGGKIWGNDLGGNRGGPNPYDGNYRRNTLNWLESAPIDCRGQTGLILGFLRWLSVEDGEFDHARVLVNGTLVWENPVGADLIDTSWQAVEYDVSALADNNPSVVIRFEMDSDGGLQYGGWNIDDLRLFNRTIECVPAAGCGAPPVPGPVGPVLRATGVADQNGAEFAWPSAVLGALEEYRLYRGTLASNVTMQVTPPGLTATSFDDRTAPGALYFYRLVLTNCNGQDGPVSP